MKNNSINIKTVLLMSVLLIGFPIQAGFAENSLQDGVWDFDFAGLILSNTKIVTGNQIEIIVPIYNTGIETGSVLITIMIKGPNAEKYYGETKVFDIIPNLQNNNFATFSFTPIYSGTYSIDTAIQTPDAAHVFDSSKQSFILEIYDTEESIPIMDSIGIVAVELDIQQTSKIVDSIENTPLENIPKPLSVEAYTEPKIIENISNQVNSNELNQLKIDIQKLKNSINILEIGLVILGLIILAGIIVIAIKKKKSIKNPMLKVYNYYKKPIEK